MEDIIKELKELEELVMRCMKCGACQSVCPLYQKDLIEQSVARSKIALIESVYEGRLEDAGKILKYIDYCILCGRCKANCPSGVKVDEIFLRARSVLRKIQKMKGWQKAVLKIAMEKPELLAKLAPLMHIALKFSSKKVRDDVFQPILKEYSDRRVVSIKKEPFTNKFKGLHRARNERMRAIFYPGCAVNFIFPRIGESIIGLLNYCNVSVEVGDVSKCCGIPAASLGDIELYKKMVHENLDYFDSLKPDYIITCCPTCEYGLKDLGLRTTERKPQTQIIDILVFLEEVAGLEIMVEINEKISLHMPCHYDTSKSAVPVKFLKKHIKGDFMPLENQDCCGFGGTFSMKFYKNSKQISVPKAEEVKSKGIKHLFTPCPGCIMQLTDALSTIESDAKASHPVEMLYGEIEKQVRDSAR